jgi:chitinase
VYDYKQLPLPGCEVRTDDSITASWCYDPIKRFMVSYDTPDVIAKKSQFIREQGLGGGMWWESSSDSKGDKSLISTVRFLLTFYPAYLFDHRHGYGEVD